MRIAAAESCTGGLVGALLTTMPGSSDFFILDVVAYSNEAKTRSLGVGVEVLRDHGAVSSEVAAAMADGVLRAADADVAVSVTGIAGPGGGTEAKPVGTVWIGLARKNKPTFTKNYRLRWDRDRNRTLAAYVALRALARVASGREPEP